MKRGPLWGSPIVVRRLAPRVGIGALRAPGDGFLPDFVLWRFLSPADAQALTPWTSVDW
ncbi:MAG: hypothetical protein AAB214_07270 [Fibrobacterota bacterium]